MGALLVAVSLVYLASQVRLANRISLLPYTRDVWPFIRDNDPPDTVRFVEGFLGFDRPIGPEASLSTPQETPPST